MAFYTTTPYTTAVTTAVPYAPVSPVLSERVVSYVPAVQPTVPVVTTSQPPSPGRVNRPWAQDDSLEHRLNEARQAHQALYGDIVVSSPRPVAAPLYSTVSAVSAPSTVFEPIHRFTPVANLSFTRQRAESVPPGGGNRVLSPSPVTVLQLQTENLKLREELLSLREEMQDSNLLRQEFEHVRERARNETELLNVERDVSNIRTGVDMEILKRQVSILTSERDVLAEEVRTRDGGTEIGVLLEEERLISSQLRDELRDTKEKQDKQQQKVKQQKKDMAELQETLSQKTSQVERLEQELVSVRRDKQSDSYEDQAYLRDEISDLRNQHNDYRSKLKMASEERDEYRKKMEELRRQVKTATEERDRAQSDLKHLKNANAEHEKTIKSLRGAEKTLRQEVDEMSTRLDAYIDQDERTLRKGNKSPSKSKSTRQRSEKIEVASYSSYSGSSRSSYSGYSDNDYSNAYSGAYSSAYSGGKNKKDQIYSSYGVALSGYSDSGDGESETWDANQPDSSSYSKSYSYNAAAGGRGSEVEFDLTSDMDY